MHSTESSSQPKLPYDTSGMKIPMTPTPSHSSSPEADHGSTTPIQAGPAEDRTKPEPHSGSSPGAGNLDQKDSDEQGFRFSRSNRLAVLYHKYNPQIAFENRGSTARDHLASERTFLAYVRTSLALASMGVALVQLFTMADPTSTVTQTPIGKARMKFRTLARPLGVSTVVMALIMLGIAVYRYFIIQSALPGNMFPVARISVIFTTVVVSAIVIVIFAALIAGR